MLDHHDNSTRHRAQLYKLTNYNETTLPKEGTQKRRVLDVFLKLDGARITSQRLDREYGFTQIHAR
jgi:hypothetical protein